jgi:lipopolysaccharide transport system permease protein
LIQLTIFAVVFSIFLGVKMEGQYGVWSFSLYLIPGIIFWNYTSDVIIRLGNSICRQKELIKKTPITLGTIFTSELIYCFIISSVYMLLFIVFLLALGIFANLNFNITLCLIGAICSYTLATIISVTIGVALAFITPFYHQLIITTQVLLGLLFWFTPIVYNLDKIPNTFQQFIYANPFYAPLSVMQNVITLNELQMANFTSYTSFCLFSLFVVYVFYTRFPKRIREVL